jgi:S-adenosylmethionine/arginine decarboxylase-like enzyme
MLATEPLILPDQLGEPAGWGLSISVDLLECDPRIMRSRERIREFVVRLCGLIGMRRLGDCQIVPFGDERGAGYSMLQLIDASLISGHFASDSNRAYLDLFSCRSYNARIVEAFARDYFGARDSRLNTID